VRERVGERECAVRRDYGKLTDQRVQTEEETEFVACSEEVQGVVDGEQKREYHLDDEHLVAWAHICLEHVENHSHNGDEYLEHAPQ
jgi:hypothetical protein